LNKDTFPQLRISPEGIMFEKVDDIYFLIFVIMLIDNIVGKHEHHGLLEHKSIPILMRLHKTKKIQFKAGD